MTDSEAVSTATASPRAAMSSSWRSMSARSRPRRRWVDRTATAVTPAAAVDVPPGSVRWSKETAPVVATMSGPSKTARLRSRSKTSRQSSSSWSDGWNPKARSMVRDHAWYSSSAIGRSSRSTPTVSSRRPDRALPLCAMSTTPAAWHPDPFGRFEARYWDGERWTEHVSRAGQTLVDPPLPTAPVRRPEDDYVPVGSHRPDQVQRQVARATGATGPVGGGGGSIFTEPVLVVNQKAKYIEMTNQYAVFDENGQQIAGIQQVGQSTGRKALRLLTNVDQFLTHRYEIRDAWGTLLLSLVRPGKILKSTIIVNDAGGNELGRIVQENVVGKIRFGLVDPAGNRHGGINAENWRAWNFNIQDHTGTEVARITKTFAGVVKAAFTTADNYVVQIHRPLEDPLRSLVVAAALGIDTALKQDDKN